jgi:hypothetical protein
MAFEAVALGLLGLIAICALWQLVTTRRARLSAERMSARQLRAYVGVERVQISPARSVGHVFVRNYGLTRARVISCITETSWGEASERRQWPHELGMIDPGATIVGTFPVKSGAATADGATTTTTIVYADEFGRRWRKHSTCVLDRALGGETSTSGVQHSFGGFAVSSVEQEILERIID